LKKYERRKRGKGKKKKKKQLPIQKESHFAVKRQGEHV